MSFVRNLRLVKWLCQRVLTWYKYVQTLPKGEWFCWGDCEIHTSLGELVSGGEKRLPDTSIGAIKKKQLNGIFRIFGNEVAELPLVATSSKCQGLGYFQATFEELLASLNVKILALPTANEMDQEFWLKEYKKNYQLMVLQGTSMMYKTVQKPETSKD
ncbi:zinc finger, PHD-type [Artemisia annua]|uniref:Zinc finger, PHD-type n=1 Tax=Artemisia annua TaxID=35608 RepID=A0A2U1L1A2_ARTAN|nr:zinc finger, PHD-type [Artemisia annua]